MRTALRETRRGEPTTSATPHAASNSAKPAPIAANTPRNTFTAMT